MKPLPKSNHLQNLGRFGESLASSFLEQEGYIILVTNFKARYGEIDIIAQDHDVLVFIEVKTRIGEKFGKPEEAVVPRKLHEVIKTSQYYCMLHPELPQTLRIDLVAIALTDNKAVKYLKHIKNITG